jgi:hypothetical protein
MVSKVIPFHPEAAKSPLRRRILLNPLRKNLAHLDKFAAEDKGPRALFAPVPGVCHYHDWFSGHACSFST